jgi:peptide/nickel transport system permease protein
VTAIDKIDYPAIMATTLIVAAIFVLLNLVVDILYLFLDPRISYG